MAKDSPPFAARQVRELQNALSELKASIDDFRAHATPARGNDDAHDLHLKAKLFVEAGNPIPGFAAELERRATFIERETAEGSRYDTARQAFLDSIKSARPQRNDLPVQDWLRGLRSPTFGQAGLIKELGRCIELLGWIPHQGRRVVKPQFPNAVESQGAWRIATRQIEEVARRISADGCRYLWLAERHFSDDGAMVEFHPERVWLKAIEAAAKAMTAVAAKTVSGDSPIPAEPDESDRKARSHSASDLTDAVRKAWLSFLYAEGKLGSRLEDREAWDHLHEYGIDAEGEELEGYDLPSFDTWSRTLRTARRQLKENKYHRRTKPTGKTVVKKTQI